MLDRILKQTLWVATLTGWLVAAGCGTSQSSSTAPDEIPAAPPRILTGMIIEMPEVSAAVLDSPVPLESPRPIASPSLGPTKKIGQANPKPRYRSKRQSGPARVDLGVRPAAASEASPIASTLSDAVTTEENNSPQTRPELPTRTPQMVAAIQQAEEHNRQGFALASRGACFSARAEFIRALQTISQGLDSDTGGADFGRALAAGMRALEEAEDFVPRGSRLSGEIDLAMLARAHRTPMLRDAKTLSSPPAAAAQRYQKYAVEQLSSSIGGEVVGSLALHSLGKLYGLFAQDPANTTVDPRGKAIVFQRAALQVDPNNYLAANELAVLLAQQGGNGEARDLLLRAIAINPRPSMWHNLAVVHANLGEMELADLAQRTALAAAGGANPGNVQAMAALHAVRWVDPATFAHMSQPPADLNPAPPGAKPQQAAPLASPPEDKPPQPPSVTPPPADKPQQPARVAPPAGIQKGITRWGPRHKRQE